MAVIAIWVIQKQWSSGTSFCTQELESPLNWLKNCSFHPIERDQTKYWRYFRGILKNASGSTPMPPIHGDWPGGGNGEAGSLKSYHQRYHQGSIEDQWRSSDSSVVSWTLFGPLKGIHSHLRCLKSDFLNHQSLIYVMSVYIRIYVRTYNT